MSEFGGFFNSVAGDRKYKAEDFANYFKTFIGNGVNPSKETLNVAIKSGNKISISKGSACINGYLYLNSSELIKDINTNIVQRVVLALDIANRTLDIYVKQGTNTAPPELTRNDIKHELSIAKITPNGSSVNIADERGDELLCGYMSFTGKDDLQGMWNIFNKEWKIYKDLWQDWFVNMQGNSIRGIYIQESAPTSSKVGDIWIDIL